MRRHALMFPLRLAKLLKKMFAKKSMKRNVKPFMRSSADMGEVIARMLQKMFAILFQAKSAIKFRSKPAILSQSPNVSIFQLLHQQKVVNLGK